MRFEVLKGLSSEIDEVAAVATPSHGFLTRAWFRAAADAYQLAAATTLVARRRNGHPVIALPLARWRPSLRGVHVVPGCYWPFRSFPVAEDLRSEEMTAFLQDRVIRRALGFVWRLGPINIDDPAIMMLHEAAGRAGWSHLSRRIATSFVLDFEKAQEHGPWPRGTTLRKNRFHEKHLGTHGPLEWRYVVGREWSHDVLDALAAIETQSWVGTRTDLSNAKFIDGPHRRFWESVANDPRLAERMWAALLYVAGKPTAFSFDLDSGPVKYAIANSYVPALGKHSPGKVLYYRNLVVAMSRGIRRVDWGAGDSGYKTTMGAEAGSEMHDYLFVRGRRVGPAVARLASSLWSRSGNESTKGSALKVSDDPE